MEDKSYNTSNINRNVGDISLNIFSLLNKMHTNELVKIESNLSIISITSIEFN